MDKNSGLIHSADVTAANLHVLHSASESLNNVEKVIDTDIDYQRINKRPEIENKTTGFWVAIRPGNSAF